MSNQQRSYRKEDTLDLHSAQAPNDFFRENISEYVAELQLHMALQARNLIPTLTKASDSREQFLQQTQATIEKLVSRQAI
jgi:triphosphoribosyl-dephospho-CoA synthetase